MDWFHDTLGNAKYTKHNSTIKFRNLVNCPYRLCKVYHLQIGFIAWEDFVCFYLLSLGRFCLLLSSFSFCVSANLLVYCLISFLAIVAKGTSTIIEVDNSHCHNSNKSIRIISCMMECSVFSMPRAFLS